MRGWYRSLAWVEKEVARPGQPPRSLGPWRFGKERCQEPCEVSSLQARSAGCESVGSGQQRPIRTDSTGRHF